MAQLPGNHFAGLAVALLIQAMELAAVHWGGVAGDQLEAFAGIRGAQLMKALDAMFVQ